MRSWISGSVALVMVLFAAGAYTLTHWKGLPSGRDILHSEESRYQNLYITKNDSVITLRAGSLLVKSSAMDLADPQRLVIEYTRMMMLGVGYVDEPRRILIIGLGGGTLTKYLRHYYPEAHIVSVEFDDAVARLAREYFHFEPDKNMEVAVMDGRRYLASTDLLFDLVFLDAFHGDYIPFHLMTREFLELVKSRLTSDGVVVSNTWTGQKLAGRESATYRAVFGAFDHYVGKTTSNRIIVARRDGAQISRQELARHMSRTQQRIGFQEIDLVQLFELHHKDTPPLSQDKVLTDDFAPVNLLVDRRPYKESDQ